MSTTVLAIDPGSRESAWMIYDGTPRSWAKEPNDTIVKCLRARTFAARNLVIESMVNYAATVGAETFDAIRWAGRFQEAWAINFGEDSVSYLTRPEVKLHLCQSMRAKDKDVREALITRWGGEDKAIGGEKCPHCKGKGHFGRTRSPCAACGVTGLQSPRGVLHGITSDCWSALAIGTTWTDKTKALTPSGAGRGGNTEAQ